MRIFANENVGIGILLASIPFINALLAFAEGFSGRVWAILLLPIQTFPLLLAVGLLGMIIFQLLKTIKKDRRPINILPLLLAPVVFFSALFSLPPGGFWFLQGFRYGVMQRVSMAEISEIAGIATTVVPNGSLILPPNIGGNRGEADNSNRWSDFVSRAPVGRLNKPFVVYHHDGTVQLEWGGALTGHWGLRVGHPVIRRDRDYYFIPMSENAAAYFTD